MIKRKYALLGIASVTVALVVTWTIHKYRPFDAVNPFQCYRIELGMPLEDAEAVIGRPPGTYRTKQSFGGITSPVNHGFDVANHGVDTGKLCPGCKLQIWWGTYYGIYVVIDENNCVIGKSLIEIPW